jgi:chromosome partitioning protein
MVVIDYPPQLHEVQRTVMMLSAFVLLPTEPSALDVGALAQSIDLVKDAQRGKPSLRAALVITRQQPRTTIGREVHAVLDRSGVPVLGVACSFRVTYQEMIAARMGQTTYAPKSPAADEVRALVTELEAVRRGPRPRARPRAGGSPRASCSRCAGPRPSPRRMRRRRRRRSTRSSARSSAAVPRAPQG